MPVLMVMSADGQLALDLTVDQPLGEWHVYRAWLVSPGAAAHVGLYEVVVPEALAHGDSDRVWV